MRWYHGCDAGMGLVLSLCLPPLSCTSALLSVPATHLGAPLSLMKEKPLTLSKGTFPLLALCIINLKHCRGMSWVSLLSHESSHHLVSVKCLILGGAWHPWQLQSKLL